MGSKEWLEDIAIPIPSNKKRLSQISFESKNQIHEDILVYSLKTSKREAAYFTRNIK